MANDEAAKLEYELHAHMHELFRFFVNAEEEFPNQGISWRLSNVAILNIIDGLLRTYAKKDPELTTFYRDIHARIIANAQKTALNN